MQIKLQRRPCGFPSTLFPVSLQQLLVVTVKDCKELHSIAYLNLEVKYKFNHLLSIEVFAQFQKLKFAACAIEILHTACDTVGNVLC